MEFHGLKGVDTILYAIIAATVIFSALIGCFILIARSREVPVSKYKAEWKPQSRNEEFWNEVLVDRKIVGITWDGDGMTGFTLDSGEWVGIKKNENAVATLFIQD